MGPTAVGCRWVDRRTVVDGRAVIAIREDYIAAAATGINVTYYKVMTFVLSAFFAGVAGAI